MADQDSEHPALAEAPQPRLLARAWSLNTLALLAILYTLYYARAFILPVVIAVLLALLLSPLVGALYRLRIRHAVGAAIVVLSLVGVVGSALYLLSGPAAQWVEQAPQLARQLERKIHPLRETVAEVNRAAERVENIGQGEEQVPLVKLQERSLREIVVERVQATGASTVMVIFLLYFLLASGERFVRNVMTALPSWRDKRRAWEISLHVQHEISAYLFTITLINSALAAVTGGAMYLLGLPNPLLWGVMAGVFNFVPYLGPAFTVAVLTVVSTLSFDTPREMLVPPLVFFVITSLEGQLITPTILGQRLALNPIMIFLGLIFWGWLWGIAGALLAVPIMVTVKIVCDHVEALQPIGTAMGR